MMKCFLDMDGVLVDFMKGAHEFHRLPYSMKAYPYEFGVWDNCPPSTSELSTQEFWDSLDEEFWANLDWMPDGNAILQYTESFFGVKNICLLTSPTRCPRSVSGKLLWIQKNLPRYKRQFLIGPPKHFCAHNNAVLIDDSDRNINSFVEHGGTGVLVPRPWNSEYMDRKESLLSTYLKLIDVLDKHDRIEAI